ncbi:MAG: hypothetical protein ACFFDQ_05015 [Candidatus Thorarchaeota archaeon]
MVNDDSVRLQRFRRVAQNHRLQLPTIKMPADSEINYLREQLNAYVYLEAEPWMLPSWADLTLNDYDSEEVLISELPNNAYRNWSPIGGVGSKKFGLADSRGLVTTIPSCGAIDVWVLGSDGITFPALMGKDQPQLKLVSTEDQLYEWKTHIQSVDFTRLVYHVEDQDIDYLYNEIVLKNISLEPATMTFYFTLRPMSVMGFEPIETIEFDATNNQVFVNETLAVRLDTSPSAVYLVDANDISIPEAILSDKTRYDYKIFSKEGLGTAVLKFNVELAPAGTKTILFASPLEIYHTDVSATHKPDSHNRDLAIGKWYEFSKKRCVTIFPDERLDSVFSQASACLAIHACSLLFPEASDGSKLILNWKELMRVLLALIKSGGLDVVHQLMHKLAQTIQNIEDILDGTMVSPILWGFLKMQGYSLERESLHDIHNHLVFLAERLITKLAADHLGKIEVGHFSNEHLENEAEDAPLEHYRLLNSSMLMEFNELLWDFAALKESLNYFSLTEVALASKIRNTVSQVEKYVQEKFYEIQTARWPRSNDPHMPEIDRTLLDILTSIIQLKNDGFDKPFLRSLYKDVSERRLIRGLWKTNETEEFPSSHLALRLAQFHVRDKLRDVAEPLLQRALEFLSEDFLLPDFVNPRTFGGASGNGASVLAAADLILLISDMLVFENQNNLVFLAGIPSEWFTAKKPLTINGIPTRFGKTHIDIGLSANQHQIETGMELLPDEIEIHLPDTTPLRMVKAYGGSIVDRAMKDRSPHLRLIPLSNDVVLTYHR